jgi:HAE1 family hydrophobic/amphiphilic exporter-1
MVIARRQERPILLGDVARIEDGQEEQRSLALVNGVPAVALEVLKQSKANVVGVADAVKSEIETLQKEMPAETRIEVVQDSSGYIKESVADVQETIIIGGILTILIVFCFLNSWRSTVITGLTLPISVLSSFIAIYFLNMTINVMTLMALSLAIGLLIDDAIVVRENIVRHLEQGQDHFTAARDGTSEIGLAVLATTLSIVAVFIPVAFMKGIVGRFFFQFGMTVTFAVLVSLFVSFTLDPMLSSRWYDPDVEGKGRRNILARLLDRFNHWFDRTANQYKAVIDWALRHRPTMVFLATAAFALGLVAFFSVETSFFPNADQGEFQVKFKTAPDASLTESRNRLEAVLAAIRDLPEIDHTYSTVGAGETSTIRDGRIYIKLTERKHRERHQERVRVEIRSRLATIPGIIPSVEQAADNFSQKPIQVNIRGEEIPLLKSYSAQLKTIMTGIPGIVDLEASMEQDTPEYRLVIDRKRASDVGLMTAQVVQTLSALVGGQAVSTFEDEAGEAIDVRLRLPQEQRQDLTRIGNLRLSLLRPEGGVGLIPLHEFAQYQASITPSEINRQNMTREVVVSANLDNLALGTAMARIQQASGKIAMEPGYTIVFSGEAEDMMESFGYMAEALLLAVIFVYLILASQFESFVDPLAIMLSLPLSIVGMAGLLYLTGDTINIMSLIGLIMLMGLVTKNAILLVDYAKVLQTRGYSRHDAVVLAGRTRLRPIMMTTLAMIFGMLPLALGIGAGGEMRAPMARAVIGGLITSTMLTLLVVPVVYTLLDDLVEKLKIHHPHAVEVEK